MQELGIIIDAIGVPVIATDADAMILAMNETARMLYPDAAINMPVSKLISKKSLTRFIALAAETGEEQTLTVRSSENAARDVYVTVKPVERDKDRDSPVLIITLEDRSPLRAAKEMRSDFVANVSHEIRSPLTSISGFIETLQGPAGEDAKARNEFLGYMAKESDRMTNLVTDLLSLSLVEVKQRRALKKSVDLYQILSSACRTVDAKAQKRNIEIRTEFEDNLPEIRGHFDNLLRVFINIIENAMNYSADNTVVTVRTDVVEAMPDFGPSAIRISVADQGIGIDAFEIPRLTERFYRCDKSRSRAVGGTGLGLAIVKHVLVRHRGKLVIESEPGVGSTFSVYLPLENGR